MREHIASMVQTQSEEAPIPPQTESEGFGPTRLSKREWIVVLKRTLAESQADRVSIVAAGVAFYWFLALFPGLIAAVGIFDLVDAGSAVTEGMKQAITSALPDDAAALLTDTLDDASKPRERASLLAAIFGIALALWSASTGMAAIQSGLNVAYDVRLDRRFLEKRLNAVTLVLATVTFGGLAATMLLLGNRIGDWIRLNLPGAEVLGFGWDVTRWAAALAGMTVLLAIIYYIGPNRERPSWKWITPGGILATVGWLVASRGFGIYVSNFGESSYAETYASLAGVVILVLWLYLSAGAIMIGAEMNAELERRSAELSGELPPGTYIESERPDTSGKRRTNLGKILALGLLYYVMRKRKGGP